MRSTVDIAEEQHRQLTALAQRRGMCLRHGLPLATRDVRHFERIDGLSLVEVD